MSEENKNEIIESEDAEKETSNEVHKPNRKPMYIALSVIGVVVLGALLIYLVRNRQGGEVVSAPRSVTFDENGNQDTSATTEEQIITLAPEQVERIGVKIETVGETMSSEAAELAATGVV